MLPSRTSAALRNNQQHCLNAYRLWFHESLLEFGLKTSEVELMIFCSGLFSKILKSAQPFCHNINVPMSHTQSSLQPKRIGYDRNASSRVWCGFGQSTPILQKKYGHRCHDRPLVILHEHYIFVWCRRVHNTSTLEHCPFFSTHPQNPSIFSKTYHDYSMEKCAVLLVSKKATSCFTCVKTARIEFLHAF
jgi:hypothetical protein